MDPITAIGLAISAGGFIDSLFGKSKAKKLAKQQNKIANQISALSQQEDDLRKEAATNDVIATNRQQMRAAQIARATALSNATNQGAAQSSALQGGYGQIAGEYGAESAGLFGDYNAGQEIFDLNKQQTGLQNKYNQLGGKIQQQNNRGQDLMAFGKSLVGYAPQINNTAAGVRNIFAGL